MHSIPRRSSERPRGAASASGLARRSRAALRAIHLWLGLTVGLLFAVLGLTGSALVFYVEIDAWLNPSASEAVSTPAPDWSSAAWDRSLATVERTWPGRQGQWRFEATGRQEPIPARYYSEAGGHARSQMVWLSADGAQVLRQDQWGEYLMTWIYDLHMNLLAGDTGKQVAGWSGIGMVLLLVTGLAAWWPRGSWRKAVAFKRHAVPLRRLRDWHKLSGLWSLLLLLLFAATGVMLALPRERDWALTRVVGQVDAAPTPVSASPPGRRIPIARALDAARRALPDARLAWIEVPGKPDGVFRIRVQVPGDPSRRFPRSYVFVDQRSGQVLAVIDARRAGGATTVANWLHPLHDASIGGTATRVLAFVAGFVPAVLFVTGLLHWRRRRSARAQSSSSFQGIPHHA